MDVNQFAVYQLKNIPENRQMRFRPYSVLQEKGIQIRCKDYEQVYCLYNGVKTLALRRNL